MTLNTCPTCNMELVPVSATGSYAIHGNLDHGKCEMSGKPDALLTKLINRYHDVELAKVAYAQLTK